MSNIKHFLQNRSFQNSFHIRFQIFSLLILNLRRYFYALYAERDVLYLGIGKNFYNRVGKTFLARCAPCAPHSGIIPLHKAVHKNKESCKAGFSAYNGSLSRRLSFALRCAIIAIFYDFLHFASNTPFSTTMKMISPALTWSPRIIFAARVSTDFCRYRLRGLAPYTGS